MSNLFSELVNKLVNKLVKKLLIALLNNFLNKVFGIVNQLNKNHWADWYPYWSLLLSWFIAYPDHLADYPYCYPYYLADWYWAELPLLVATRRNPWTPGTNWPRALCPDVAPASCVVPPTGCAQPWSSNMAVRRCWVDLPFGKLSWKPSIGQIVGFYLPIYLFFITWGLFGGDVHGSRLAMSEFITGFDLCRVRFEGFLA